MNRLSDVITIPTSESFDESPQYLAMVKREAEEKERKLDDRLSQCGFPKRLLRATFDQFTTPTEAHHAALVAAKGYAAMFRKPAPAPGRCATFYGAPGTGKTHLACAIMRAVCREFGVRYTTVSQLARAVRSTYHRSSSETEADILEAHINPSLLTIDEVGVGLGTDHERAMLHDVVAGRYDEMRPTIICSNLSLEAVRDALGERLVDRMREDGGLAISFDWPSFRGIAR